VRDKIQALHLKRRPFVYVPQSTAMQVFANTESAARQYGLVDRAYALGWPENAVEVIDEYLGRSGATADNRSGFQRLVEAVCAPRGRSDLYIASFTAGMLISGLATNAGVMRRWLRLWSATSMRSTIRERSTTNCYSISRGRCRKRSALAASPAQLRAARAMHGAMKRFGVSQPQVMQWIERAMLKLSARTLKTIKAFGGSR